MPNKYKRAVGSRTYRNYTDEILKTCLNDIINKKITQREAEKLYNILRRTLNYKLKKQHGNHWGRPTIFSEEEEKCFTSHIILMSYYGFPVDKTDFRYIVKSYLDRLGKKVNTFKNNLPGLSWVSNFLKRNKTLSYRLATNIKRSRAAINEDIIRQYINNLQKTIGDVLPENIYNYDETNLTDNPGQKKVIVKRGSKYPERICNTSKVSISLMMCGNAAGQLLPPYVVYKAKGLWQPWTEGGPTGCRYNASPSGWFDASIFCDWFDKVLIRNLKKTPGKKVVIGDNLSSHISPYIIDKCKQENIYFICLPPNSTHLTQPLDVPFFHPMKVARRKILSDWKTTPEGIQNATLQKQSFPKLLKKLLDVLTLNMESTLKNGFRKCGIFPCNADELLARLPQAINVSSTVEESFIEHLNNKRSETTQTKKQIRKKLKIAPGLSYAHEGDSSEIDEPEPNNNEDVGQNLVVEDDLDIFCPVSENGKYSINDFVIFKYDETLYPGRIINTTENGAFIQSMEKSKKYYRWPVKTDEMFYSWIYIMMKINPPTLIRRGYFKVNELEEYTE